MSKYEIGEIAQLYFPNEMFLNDDEIASAPESEKNSFDFTSLMQKLKETRKTTIKYAGKGTTEGLHKSFQQEKFILPRNKENRDFNTNNSDEYDYEKETDSEIELSWRPLDEIALKRKALNRVGNCFKPMPGDDRDDNQKKGKFTGGCAQLLGFPAQTPGPQEEAYMLDRGGSTEDIKSSVKKAHPVDFSTRRKPTQDENDKEYFEVEAVLGGIKDDIKQTLQKVDDINKFIYSKIDSSTREANMDKQNEITRIETNDYQVSECIPGTFPERMIYLRDIVQAPEEQTNHLKSIDWMKWLVSWPIKWKIAYYFGCHVLSFSNKDYSISQKSMDLLENSNTLTIPELDKLLGCYMAYRVISRNLYDISSALNEIYDYSYKFILQYDDLHPLQQKKWKELFTYGALNISLVFFGTLTLEMFLSPGKTSSPVFGCLWNIGFGSSQKAGLAIMLTLFYLNLTKETLHKFNIHVKKEIEKEKEEQFRTAQQSEYPNKLNLKERFSCTNVYPQKDVSDIIVDENDQGTKDYCSALLESTPPFTRNADSLMAQSPLLKKSSNVIASDSIRLAPLSQPEKGKGSWRNIEEVHLIKTSNKTSYDIFFAVLSKILILTSSLLQQPISTSKRLRPRRILRSIKKIVNTPL